MKEKILALLTAKFEGVSKAILERIATKKAETVTTEEQATQLVEGLTLQSVLDSYADSRATEAAQTAIANYEKKNGIKDGKPIEVVDPVKGAQVEEPNLSSIVAKAVADAVKPLSEKLSMFEQTEKQAKRNADIQAKAKEYGIPETFAQKFNITEDADIDTYLKDVKQELINLGFDGVKTPDVGGGAPNNGSDIANLINQGTKEIVESKK